MASPGFDATPRPQEVKHALHKEVFLPNGERLVGFMKVSKTEGATLPFNKKENVHYLCLSVTVKRPPKVFISRYRRPDKGEGYEQRRKWNLEELTASVATEREEFLQNLASLCAKYLDGRTPPPFENVSSKVSKALPAVADVGSQMDKNRRDLLERGHKLSSVETKTAEMAESAKSFSQTAHELANYYKN